MCRVPAGLKPAFRHQFPPSPGNFSVALFRDFFLMAVCATRGALRGRGRRKAKRMEVTTSSWSCPHPGGAGGIKAVCLSSAAPGCVLCAAAAVDVIPRALRVSSVTKPGSFISDRRPLRLRGRRSEILFQLNHCQLNNEALCIRTNSIPAVGQPLRLAVPLVPGAPSSAWLARSQQAGAHHPGDGAAGDSIALCVLQPITSAGLRCSKPLTPAGTRVDFIALMSKGSPLGAETHRWLHKSKTLHLSIQPSTAGTP